MCVRESVCECEFVCVCECVSVSVWVQVHFARLQRHVRLKVDVFYHAV